MTDATTVGGGDLHRQPVSADGPLLRDRRVLNQRIALIGNQAFAVVNFRSPLIRALIASGYQVFALAPDYDDALRQKVSALGATPVDFPLSRAGMNPFQEIRSLIEVAALMRRLRIDQSICYTIKPAIFSNIGAAIGGVGRRLVLLEGLGHAFMPGADATASRWLLKRAVTMLYGLSFTVAHRVLFLNQDDLEELVDLRILPRRKAFNAGAIGIDLDQWPPAPPVSEPVSFVFVGRLLREKGIAEFVEAARIVKARHRGTRFTILGGLDDNPSAVSEADMRAWAREGLVDWHGHGDTRAALRAASVFVLPSYREGMPRSTQEAMAMARPVITTDVPGCRDTVVDGRNGFLVPRADVDRLAQAMERFIEKPDLIRTMGAESRILAEQRFSADRFNATILEALA